MENILADSLPANSKKICLEIWHDFFQFYREKSRGQINSWGFSSILQSSSSWKTEQKIHDLVQVLCHQFLPSKISSGLLAQLSSDKNVDQVISKCPPKTGSCLYTWTDQGVCVSWLQWSLLPRPSSSCHHGILGRTLNACPDFSSHWTFCLTRLFVSPDFLLRTTGYTLKHTLTGVTTAAAAAVASSKQAAGMLHQITSAKPEGQCKWLRGFCHCIWSGLVSWNWRIMGYLQQKRNEGTSALLLWRRWQDEAVSICKERWEATPCHEIKAVLSYLDFVQIVMKTEIYLYIKCNAHVYVCPFDFKVVHDWFQSWLLWDKPHWDEQSDEMKSPMRQTILTWKVRWDKKSSRQKSGETKSRWILWMVEVCVKLRICVTSVKSYLCFRWKGWLLNTFAMSLKVSEELWLEQRRSKKEELEASSSPLQPKVKMSPMLKGSTNISQNWRWKQTLKVVNCFVAVPQNVLTSKCLWPSTCFVRLEGMWRSTWDLQMGKSILATAFTQVLQLLLQPTWPVPQLCKLTLDGQVRKLLKSKTCFCFFNIWP